MMRRFSSFNLDEHCWVNQHKINDLDNDDDRLHDLSKRNTAMMLTNDNEKQ